MTRRYRPGTTILETCFETAEGAVTLIDFMPLADDQDHVGLVRIVRGDHGRVEMGMDPALRFDYGRTAPWVTRIFGWSSCSAKPKACA